MIRQPGSSSNLQRLASLLYESQPTVPVAVCRSYQSELPIFVTDELAGQAVDRDFGGLVDHLDICPICLREYLTLTKLMGNALLDEGNL